MSNPELPVVLTPEDRARVELKLVELRESSDGSGALSMFLPGARQVIMLVAHHGEIASWCLMPARDEGRARTLAVQLKHVLAREVASVCREVKALGDTMIDRASRIA